MDIDSILCADICVCMYTYIYIYIEPILRPVTSKNMVLLPKLPQDNAPEIMSSLAQNLSSVVF